MCPQGLRSAASPFHPRPGTLGLGAWESCSAHGWRSRDRAPGDTPAPHTPTPMLRWKPRLGVCGGGGEVARTGQRAVTHGGADGGSGGAHLPVPVSHHTLLAFEGTVVGILHIFRVADLRQGWGTGGGRLQKPQSPSEHPPRQRPGQRQTLCTGVSPSVSACLGRSWKLKLGRGCPAG